MPTSKTPNGAIARLPSKCPVIAMRDCLSTYRRREVHCRGRKERRVVGCNGPANVQPPSRSQPDSPLLLGVNQILPCWGQPNSPSCWGSTKFPCWGSTKFPHGWGSTKFPPAGGQPNPPGWGSTEFPPAGGQPNSPGWGSTTLLLGVNQIPPPAGGQPNSPSCWGSTKFPLRWGSTKFPLRLGVNQIPPPAGGQPNSPQFPSPAHGGGLGWGHMSNWNRVRQAGR